MTMTEMIKIHKIKTTRSGQIVNIHNEKHFKSAYKIVQKQERPRLTSEYNENALNVFRIGTIKYYEI